MSVYDRTFSGRFRRRSASYKAAFDAWCRFYVDTENFDRQLPHVVGRDGDAMPLPKWMAASRRHASDARRQTLREVGLDTSREARRNVEQLTSAEQARAIGAELLPLSPKFT